jgi:hypothetical protein
MFSRDTGRLGNDGVSVLWTLLLPPPSTGCVARESEDSKAVDTVASIGMFPDVSGPCNSPTFVPETAWPCNVDRGAVRLGVSLLLIVVVVVVGIVVSVVAVTDGGGTVVDTDVDGGVVVLAFWRNDKRRWSAARTPHKAVFVRGGKPDRYVYALLYDGTTT